MNRPSNHRPERDNGRADEAARPVAPKRAVTEEFDGPAPDEDDWPDEPLLHDA